MKRNEILSVHGQEYVRMTKQLLEAADAASMLPGKQALIGIKPNLLGPIPAEEGATTHPEIVAGIIEYLRDNGFENLVVLESSWVGDRTKDSLLVTGFDRLCEQYDVPFWDLQEDRPVSRDCAGLELQICERAAKIDFLINVPVLKGHCQTRMTCALKNMKGLLPASEKRRFHRMGLHEPIGHLSAGIRQGLIIVDSICPDLTFEDGGHPVQLDRIFAAADPVLCDAYGAGLLGLSPQDVPYIQIAADLGAGSTDLQTAVVRELGKDIGSGRPSPEENRSLLTEGEERPDWRRILKIEENVTSVDTCSACYASLLPALVKLDEEGLLEKLPGRICMGQGYRGRSGEYGVGSCTRGFAHSLAGCPPTGEAVEVWLREQIAGCE